ncbi:MAG: glutamine--fructose-6-phosphate transaminase (isomerizing) [Bdellovibrionota bacterium]
MCGIVGYVGNKDASNIIISALRRLEYRGYDSAGMAGFEESPSHGLELEVRRCEGNIDRLQALIDKHPLKSSVGIGHTRWATHGKPSEKNAHPHRYRDVVIVHNGIIENYSQLKRDLEKQGHRFQSETDSEVVAHLLQRSLDLTGDFEKSVKFLVSQLKGAFALAALWEKNPNCIFVAKQHSPILIGVGAHENFIASDIPALLEFTNEFIILNDSEMAFVEPEKIRVFDFKGKEMPQRKKRIEWSLSMAEKEGFDHFMMKEIFEQPRVVQDGLRGYLSGDLSSVHFDEVKFSKADWKSFQNISIVGCGTAWHAGLLGKQMIETLARVHTEVDLASEFRYRKPVLPAKSLSIAISQSGETADTLAAIDEAKKLKSKLLSITNTVESSVVRKTKNVIYTHAGPEISVASTKCFTAQVVSLYLLAIKLASEKKTQSQSFLKKFLRDLTKLPQLIEATLKNDEQIKLLAKKYFEFENFFYLGRGTNYPIALEGALKLKEIAYINTQAYPAGEMKHGPIALISSEWPVVCLAPRDAILSKMLSNIEAVCARGGRVIAFTTSGEDQVKQLAEDVVEIPKSREEFHPILINICLQIFAYHMSVLRGCNVDRPRNLAKSVTVE